MEKHSIRSSTCPHTIPDPRQHINKHLIAHIALHSHTHLYMYTYMYRQAGTGVRARARTHTHKHTHTHKYHILSLICLSYTKFLVSLLMFTLYPPLPSPQHTHTYTHQFKNAHSSHQVHTPSSLSPSWLFSSFSSSSLSWWCSSTVVS